MSYASNGDVRLHWQEAGSGTPVLLIMGHAFPSKMWYPVIPALSERHRVVWFDNRGTGQSDAPRHATIHDLVDDALAVLDAAGVEKAHVFGVSMGGGIALQLGHDHPDRVTSLVLGCTAFKTEDLPVKGLADRLKYYIPRGLMKKAMGDGAAMYGPACDKAAALHDIEVLFSEKIRPRGLLAQQEAMRTYALTVDKVATITLPTLVQHGDVDLTVDVERGRAIAAAIPGAELSIYEGAGHNYIVPMKDRVNAELLDFFSRVDQRATASA